jgi:CubicO group peptidase (beta-lactamase class C family)
MKKTIRFLLIISFVSTLYAQNSPNFEQLEKYIKESMKEYNLPGLAMGIIHKDSVVFAKAYGVKSTETNEPVTLNSLFGIASLSKAFTAAAVGMLVDEGLLKWDDHVIDHLPNFKLFDPYATREMRVRDLLCHRSGLATFDGDLLWYGTDYTRDEIVDRISEMEPKHSFRYSYGYSNIMFIVAGELIKEVTGKSWDDFITERIFTPLNMINSTTTNSVFNETTDVAIPHLNGEVQPFINYDNSGPAASINSSVNDLIKWMKLWLNKGVANADTLFSESSYYTITKSHTALSGGRGEEINGRHFSNAALGWFLSDYAGRKIISHGGGLPGYISRLTLVPEDSLGIIVLTNDDSRLAGAISSKVIDMYFTEKDIDYAKQADERYRKYVKSYWNHIDTLNKVIPQSLENKSYTGVYEDKMYGSAKVELLNDELYLTLNAAKELFNSKLSHYNRDTFRFCFNDPFLPEGLITFHFNSRGEIINFTIDLPNPDFHFYNLDFKSVEN